MKTIIHRISETYNDVVKLKSRSFQNISCLYIFYNENWWEIPIILIYHGKYITLSCLRTIHIISHILSTSIGELKYNKYITRYVVIHFHLNFPIFIIHE